MQSAALQSRCPMRGSVATREHASLVPLRFILTFKKLALRFPRPSPLPCPLRLFVVAFDSSLHGPLTTLTRPRVAHRSCTSSIACPVCAAQPSAAAVIRRALRQHSSSCSTAGVAARAWRHSVGRHGHVPAAAAIPTHEASALGTCCGGMQRDRCGASGTVSERCPPVLGRCSRPRATSR